MTTRQIHPTDKLVGQRLRQARCNLGKTQTELADVLGIKFQQVQKYETGANRISASRLATAAEFLGKPVNWFFEHPHVEEPIDHREHRLLRYFRKLDQTKQDKVMALLATMETT